MVPRVMPECYLCGKGAVQRCSGCHKENYCSLHCQKTAFPIHKWQCKNSSSTFVFPPLKPHDADAYRKRDPAVVGRPVGPRKQGFMKQLRKLNLYKGDRESLLRSLQLPISSCDIPEPLRSALLLFVGFSICETYPVHAGSLPPGEVFPPTPFQSGVGGWAHWHLESLRNLGKSAATPQPYSLFVKTSPVLYPAIMMQNLMRQRVFGIHPVTGRTMRGPPSDVVSDDMLRNMLGRMEEAVGEVDLPEYERDLLRFWVVDQQAEMISCLDDDYNPETCVVM